MKLAWIELRRQPGRFALVGSALALLVLLMLFLGQLLDGLFLGSTGAIRVQEADSFVFSAEARESLLRSEVDADQIASIEAIDGVASATGMGISLLGLAVPGEADGVDGAIAGYETASGRLPAPPAPGEAFADDALEARGVELGDTLLVGPAEVPLKVVAWVEDSNYLLQNGLWVDGETWRQVQNSNRPDAFVADDEWQIAVVHFDESADAAAVSTAIETQTGGDALTEEEASFAIPGVPEQTSTLTAVIYVTVFVLGLVVALFFALLTLERTGLYALLKATGASNKSLIAGLILQAVVVAVVAYVLGALLSLLLGAVTPVGIPLEYRYSRALFVFVAVVVAAIFGGLASLRRVTRIDPASAIGAGL